MAVGVFTLSGLFGPSWQSLSREELRQAASAFFPYGTTDPQHFVDPAPYDKIHIGTPASELINGSSGRDYMLGSDGNDTISGYAGDDFINGGAGADTISAGGGNDVIVYDQYDIGVHGGAGIDTLLVQDAGQFFAGSTTLYSIERISLTNGLRDNIQFSLLQLKAGRDAELRIDGDAGDILDFATTQIAAFLGSVVENGITYDRFRIGNTSFGVQQGIIFQQGLAPDFVSAGTLALPEGQTFVTDLAAVDDTDTEGAGLTYSIVGGADAGSFTIDAVNGALNFSVAPDFETPADADGNGQYEVVVRVTDSRGLATDTGLTVDVTDVLDTPGPTLNGPGAVTAAENQTFVSDLSTLHLTESEGNGLLYAVAGGPDALLFAIDPTTGVLSFVTAPDFEHPLDSDGDNVYSVDVTVTDSAGLPSSGTIAVSVSDVFENQAPVVGGPSALSVSENSTFVVDITAIDDADAEGSGLSYAIAGGADASLFALDPATGHLAFLAAPDFEAASDQDGDNVYELSVEVTDSAGLTTSRDLMVNVTDRAAMQFVFTSGQSLSVGVTPLQSQQVLTTGPVDPVHALALDFGVNGYVNRGWLNVPVDEGRFRGFRPLQEYATETHVSSMIGRLVSEYQAAGLDSPAFTHVNTGAGGKSILQLMTRAQDVFADLTTALSSTANDDVFAIDNADGTFSYFRNDGGAGQFYQTMTGRPVFFDNLVSQLQLGVTEALRLGYDLAEDIILNFIQGQGDRPRGDIPYGYEFLLGTYFDRLEAAVESVLGSAADVMGILSQHRGYSDKGVAIDQIQFVENHPNVVFGALEYQYEALYPASVGGDYTHLSPEGYYMMGQRLGANIFDALVGQENAPIMISQVTKAASDQLLVDFSGVDNALMIDDSIYAAANGLHAPENLGFRLYRTDGTNSNYLPKITSAQIVDADTILLQFDRDVVGQFRLYLGRTQEDLLDPAFGTLIGFGGTPLRDTGSLDVAQPNGGAPLLDAHIYEYAPIQYVYLDLV